MFDFTHPAYRPLWVRIAVVAVATGWGVFELATGNPGWAVLFLSAGGYAAYKLLATFRSEDRPS